MALKLRNPFADRQTFAAPVVEHVKDDRPTPVADMAKQNKTYARVASYALYGGRDPREMPVAELFACLQQSNNKGDAVEQRYRDRIRSPLTAIRSFCVECCGGQPGHVRPCQRLDCQLWPFRMGNNPFYGRLEEIAGPEPEGKEDD